MKTSILCICLLIISLGTQCSFQNKTSDVKPFVNLTVKEARKLAKEAYIYAYPMVDGYRIQYAYFVDTSNKEYKAPYNTLFHTARVYTPEDKAVQTPNSDTPYSFAGLDLRAGPVVLTIPEIESNRYFSVQLIDYYTHNFAYIGSRTTGNKGGHYLIAGPKWSGTVPDSITQVIRCETELLIALFRTQLFSSDDIENVKKIQQQYRLTSLSPDKSINKIDFLPPVSKQELGHSLQVFNILNFQLQFCPTDSSEITLLNRLQSIGIRPGYKIDTTLIADSIKSALHAGIQDAWKEYYLVKEKVDKKEVTSGDLFGTRSFLKNKYIYRMAGALIGIYGNSKEEALYPIYTVDSSNLPLSGKNKYTITFPKDQLPPSNSFWSLTMYALPSSLLVDNPIHRYLINSNMMNQLKKNADGSYTLYIQTNAPSNDKLSNWLPAPENNFMLVMRLYWPKPSALNGTWQQPSLILTK